LVRQADGRGPRARAQGSATVDHRSGEGRPGRDDRQRLSIVRWSILTRSDEIALEELVLAIAKQGRRAWVAAALAAARHAYPIAIAAGGDEAFEWGFAEDSPSLDGE